MKRILILVGATGNLGKAILDELINDNFEKYYLIGRRIDEISSENITRFSINDITNESEVKNVFEKITVEADDKLFLISTIGGFFGGQSVEETNYEDWQRMINMNLNSSFLISKYFLKVLKSAHSGSICFISAKSSLTPEKNKVAYNISKNALNFLTKSLALEGKDYQLSANSIAPYMIDSEENRKWVSEIDELVSPKDIAKLISQIFNNYSFINGNVFILPGTINFGESEIK